MSKKGKVKQLTLEWFCEKGRTTSTLNCCTVLHLLYGAVYYNLKFECCRVGCSNVLPQHWTFQLLYMGKWFACNVNSSCVVVQRYALSMHMKSYLCLVLILCLTVVCVYIQEASLMLLR